jgi:hypothetical protein
MFKLAKENYVIRISDGATIPADERNRDYREYLAWVAEGNEPLPKDPVVITGDQVNVERDRRAHYGFMFNGKRYQFDPDSRARISGAATLAKFAIVGGAQAGNLRWMNPSADFSWIAADNTMTTMDAQTCSAFGNAAAAHEQAHVFAARALKAMDPIPDDYTDDQYWPA